MYEEKDGEILQTALRECCEEIGVKKRDIEVIGRLDDFYTLTGFVITPYVGIIPYPYPFHTSPDEVAYIIMLPYRHLKEAEPVLEMVELNGKTYKAHSIYYNGDRIWGATCRILLQFKKLIEDEET
jgi:8-oxo-dGTP pyrophosphatase MutT (NUDIX family)